MPALVEHDRTHQVEHLVTNRDPVFQLSDFDVGIGLVPGTAETGWDAPVTGVVGGRVVGIDAAPALFGVLRIGVLAEQLGIDTPDALKVRLRQRCAPGIRCPGEQEGGNAGKSDCQHHGAPGRLSR